MNEHHLPLSFSLVAAETLDTLEAVLAIARRGGLRLVYLHVVDTERATDVALTLCAADADPLALFLARLNNLVGVHDIVDHTALASAMHSN